MNNPDRAICQIVPRLPGSLDGVGDAALNLARTLLAKHGLTTIFIVASETHATSIDDFQVISGLPSGASLDELARRTRHVILHYVNYGYQPRGIPFRLRRFAREFRGRIDGRWLTTFHELYASGPPWKSEFWLRPLQVKIARDIIEISDRCVVSNDVIANEIHRIDTSKSVCIVPIMSNFGEPELTELTARSPNQWTICGGTNLILRSLRSSGLRRGQIPRANAPQSLEVIGGHNDPRIATAIRELLDDFPELLCRHHPNVTAEDASALLRTCSFAWFDYFGSGKIWPGMILKSSSFAACCAHGVVPVLSHEEPPVGVGADFLPGPYFITTDSVHLPSTNEVVTVGDQFYSWYQKHASSEQAARAYFEALG